MLLSEVQYSKKQQAKKDLVSMLSTLPKAKKLYSEDEMFQMLKESDLL